MISVVTLTFGYERTLDLRVCDVFIGGGGGGGGL